MTHDELIERTRCELVGMELHAIGFMYKHLLPKDFVIPTFEELFKERWGYDPR